MNYKTKSNLPVTRLGIGAMRMNDVQEGIRTIKAALDNGITFLNTGDFYGHGESEMIIHEVLKTHKREDIFISVKFGGMLTPDGKFYGIDARPQNVANYLAYSLKRLGTDYVDLYQPARINPHIPVEETIGAVADMVKAGYVKNIGISEVNSETLRRAHAIHPISMVEVRYSMLDRSIEETLIPAARELNIGVVTFANLFHGVIGGRNPEKTLETLSQRMMPENVEKLKEAVARLNTLESFAKEKKATISQLAIAWVLAQGKDILALVGSRTVEQLHDTVKVKDIVLTKEDLAHIEKAIPKEMAFNSAMLPLNLDENGLFKLLKFK